MRRICVDGGHCDIVSVDNLSICYLPATATQIMKNTPLATHNRELGEGIIDLYSNFVDLINLIGLRACARLRHIIPRNITTICNQYCPCGCDWLNPQNGARGATTQRKALRPTHHAIRRIGTPPNGQHTPGWPRTTIVHDGISPALHNGRWKTHLRKTT